MVVVCVAFFLCKKYTPKNDIEKVFVEYVKTDFDNPSDFIEITKIEEIDTFDYKFFKEGLDVIEGIKPILSNEKQIELKNLQDELNKDKDYYFIKAKLKVRLKRDSENRVEIFYVTNDKGKYKVYENDVNPNDVGSLALQIMQFVSDVSVYLEKFK